MLGQAQECFVEKVLSEKKKSVMVYKLASQAAHHYSVALEHVGALAGYMPSYWPCAIRVCFLFCIFEIEFKVKMQVMSSIAEYHRSVVAEQENKYGEQCARLALAESIAKEATKSAKEIPSSSPHLFLATTALVVKPTGKKDAPPSPASVMTEAAKQLLQFMTERKNAANKDNDIIYHESVPAFDSLPSLDKLTMAKPMKLSEVVPTISSVIGEDLFKGNLVAK
jgi:hypothetical protein